MMGCLNIACEGDCPVCREALVERVDHEDEDQDVVEDLIEEVIHPRPKTTEARRKQ